jgi:hypothetical protein
MRRLSRLAFFSPAATASHLLPVINQVKEYQFSVNTITIAINNILFARSYSYSTTIQPQTV